MFILAQKRFVLLTICITAFAGIFRSFNFLNRLSLGTDQISFLLLSRYALFNFKLPLWGPFSSAGPFQTGGEWYWLLMAAQAVYPFSIITPWIVFVGLSVLFVFLIIQLGKELIGKEFGIIVGSIAAVSTSQIAQGINITNQTPLALIALFALWSAIRLYRTKKRKYAFLLGLFVGLAPTIHLQGIMLLPLVFITFIFLEKKILIFLPFTLVGLCLPWIPVFWADAMNHFTNINNMIYYYRYDQYTISLDVLGRRWITYIFQFWPTSLAYIIGGNIIIAWLLIISIVVFFPLAIYKKLISKELLIIIVTLICMIIIVRYTRTPLFDSYLIVMHPFIFLLVGLVIFQAILHYRIIGYSLFLLILGGSIVRDIGEVTHQKSSLLKNDVSLIMSRLIQKYPSDKFAIYDYNYANSNKSLLLTLFLEEKNKISDSGIKIGLISTSRRRQITDPVIYSLGKGKNEYVINLSSRSNKLEKNWILVNPSAIYRSIQEWYKFKK